MKNYNSGLRFWLLAPLCVVLLSLGLSAQQTLSPEKRDFCSSIRLEPHLDDPDFVRQFQQHNERIKPFLNSFGASRSGGGPVTVPVVFVLFNDGSSSMSYINESIITKQLDLLNDQTGNNPQNPMDWKFCLANRVNGRPMTKTNALLPENTSYSLGSQTMHVGSITQGTVPGMSNPGIFMVDVSTNFAPHAACFPEWSLMTSLCTLSEANYLIIFIAVDPDGSSAFLPGLSSGCKPGILMHPEMFGAPPCSYCQIHVTEGKTLAHEVGHYFGLYHTFQNNCVGFGPPGDPVDGCDLFGDFICDTEPRRDTVVPGCDTVHCTQHILFNNYMDYTFDQCRDRFTADQITRMYATINAYYPNLFTECNLRNTGCIDVFSAGPYCSLKAINLPQLTGSAVFNKLSGPGTVQSNGEIFSSDALAGTYIVEVSECGQTGILEFEILDCCVFTPDFTWDDGPATTGRDFDIWDISTNLLAPLVRTKWTWVNNGNLVIKDIYGSNHSFYYAFPVGPYTSVKIKMEAWTDLNCSPEEVTKTIRTGLPFKQSTSADQVASRVERIQIYPTPVNDLLVVENAEGLQVRIYDLQGREVFQSEFLSSSSETIETDFLSSGMYLIKLYSYQGTQVYHNRLLVE